MVDNLSTVDASSLLGSRWPKGNRQAAAGALAGGLLRDGWSETDVETFVRQVATAAADEEADKRVDAVRATARKLKEGQPVTGWPSLAELLGNEGEQVVGQLRTQLGITPTLADLAGHKQLPLDFLESLGLHDLENGGIGIPYTDGGGKPVAVKKRLALKAGEGSLWPKGVALMAYGEARLEQAAQAGFLVLVEGESDCWALWHHGFPALGLPGANTVAKTLARGHLGRDRRLYVFQEPDQGGEVFVDAVAKRLDGLGWNGEALVVRLEGCKDPSDLHRQDPDGFSKAFQAALDRATPLTVTSSAPSGAPSPPWPSLDRAAFHGLAGEILRTIGPHTEADDAAILLQLLVAFGNVIGRTAHFRAEADRHHLNLYGVLVGASAKGRKGSSWGHVRQLFQAADEEWLTSRLQGGMSSGEGLIWAVRDPIRQRQPVKEKGRVVDYEEVEADPGVADKRLLVLESEFASVLKVLDRQGNILSTVVRQAWETGDLRTLTKTSPAKATGAHVSVIGHVTVEELGRYLSATEQANGFGNRFLWILVRRSKVLPLGGNLPTGALDHLAGRLAEAVAFGRSVDEMVLNAEATEVWRAVYGPLSDGKPGLVGALLSRAEAQVRRLACLYALLDLNNTVGPEHLQAALAVWEFAEESARHIFSGGTGDPLADKILHALLRAPAGLTRNDIRDLVGNSTPANRIGGALELLRSAGRAARSLEGTGGRAAERWVAAGGGRRG